MYSYEDLGKIRKHYLFLSQRTDPSGYIDFCFVCVCVCIWEGQESATVHTLHAEGSVTESASEKALGKDPPLCRRAFCVLYCV